MSYGLHLGDCLKAMPAMADNSVDNIVTDPPYGLLFMGKKWDYDVPSANLWAECLRVLKPGGHLLAFAGTRTQHRMARRIEDARFEIRDIIAWVYAQASPNHGTARGAARRLSLRWAQSQWRGSLWSGLYPPISCCMVAGVCALTIAVFPVNRCLRTPAAGGCLGETTQRSEAQASCLSRMRSVVGRQT